MSRLGFTVALAAALALPAAAKPTVSTDLADDANLPAYGSFAIVDPQLPPGADPVAYDRIRQAVEEALIEKGYAERPAAELKVYLLVESQEKSDVKSGGAYGVRTAVYRYTEARTTIDVYDARTRRALWHGQAVDAVNPKKSDPAAVALVMAQFPEHAAPAPAVQASDDAPAPSDAPSSHARRRSSAAGPGSGSPCCRHRARGNAGQSAPGTPEG